MSNSLPRLPLPSLCRRAHARRAARPVGRCPLVATGVGHPLPALGWWVCRPCTCTGTGWSATRAPPPHVRPPDLGVIGRSWDFGPPTPPPDQKNFPHGQNETYRRGQRTEGNFRCTEFFVPPPPPPPKRYNIAGPLSIPLLSGFDDKGQARKSHDSLTSKHQGPRACPTACRSPQPPSLGRPPPAAQHRPTSGNRLPSFLNCQPARPLQSGKGTRNGELKETDSPGLLVAFFNPR